MKTKQSKRRLISLLLTLFVVIGGAYALGGADVYRSLRDRVRAWGEPPTPRQLQAAAAFAAARKIQDSIERAPANQPKVVQHPASLAYAIGLIGAAIGFVLVVLVVSTLWPGREQMRETAGG